MYPWVQTVKYKICISSDQQWTGKSCSDLQENKHGLLIAFIVLKELYSREQEVKYRVILESPGSWMKWPLQAMCSENLASGLFFFFSYHGCQFNNEGHLAVVMGAQCDQLLRMQSVIRWGFCICLDFVLTV